MKRILMFMSFLFCISYSFSQNLVPNPDFEIYGIVPCGWSASAAAFAAATDSWTSPTDATPDIHSTLISSSCTNYSPHSTYPFCNGYQSPHSGNIFAGIYVYDNTYPSYREYIQAQLVQPMDSGHQYKVSMYISLADNSQFASNNIGIGFSNTITNALIQSELGYAPQVNFTDLITDTTSTWVYLSDTITATDQWQYLIIGNFLNDSVTTIVNIYPLVFFDRSYYYIDDVAVEELSGNSTSSFTAGDTTVCEKFCIDFFDSSANNPTSWEWIFPGGSPSSSIDQNPGGICYATPGTYDVTLITTNASGSDTLTLPGYITVYPTPPFPTITQIVDTLISSPASTYQWQLDAVDIPGATSQSYTILQSGTYTVIIGDSNGCVNSASKEVVISGIDKVNEDAGISVYPNPSNGIFTIEFTDAGGIASIEVSNTMGQILISSMYIVDGMDARKKTVNLKNEPSGMYFIKIKTAKDFLNQKVLINH
ncbi:MAG: T9SS type A sorting domain-containing protein [Chitinophagales bacterium]